MIGTPVAHSEQRQNGLQPSMEERPIIERCEFGAAGLSALALAAIESTALAQAALFNLLEGE